MPKTNDQKRASDSSLDKVRLGGLVDIISNIGFNQSPAKSKDVHGGRIYQYFLGDFASAEGKGLKADLVPVGKDLANPQFNMSAHEDVQTSPHAA